MCEKAMNNSPGVRDGLTSVRELALTGDGHFGKWMWMWMGIGEWIWYTV